MLRKWQLYFSKTLLLCLVIAFIVVRFANEENHVNCIYKPLEHYIIQAYKQNHIIGKKSWRLYIESYQLKNICVSKPVVIDNKIIINKRYKISYYMTEAGYVLELTRDNLALEQKLFSKNFDGIVNLVNQQ